MLDSEGSLIDSIYFIEEGTVHVTTDFESNEFKIDVLGPGSAINYRAVFLKDQMYVKMQAITEVKVLALNYKTLMDLVSKHGEVSSAKDPHAAAINKQRLANFSTRVLIAQNRYLKGERSYPVDYVKKMENETSDIMERQHRRNLLKNVVMRIVDETRERKRRPKLGEVIKVYKKALENDPGNAAAVKQKFQEKFIKLYAGEDKEEDENSKDEKYKHLIETMTRVKQQFSAQQVSLSNLVMRVNNLIEQKKRREEARKHSGTLPAVSKKKKSKKAMKGTSHSFLSKNSSKTANSK